MATKKIEKNIKDTAKEVAEKREKTFKVRIPVDTLNPFCLILSLNNSYKSSCLS